MITLDGVQINLKFEHVDLVAQDTEHLHCFSRKVVAVNLHICVYYDVKWHYGVRNPKLHHQLVPLTHMEFL